MGTAIIGAAAIIISCLSFLVSQRGLRTMADGSYVHSLESRIALLEADLRTTREDLKETQMENERLRAENLSLMQRLFRQDSHP